MLRGVATGFFLLYLCTFLNSCTNHISNTGSTQTDFLFTGDWQGQGTDSEGNEFTFAAKVSWLGDNKYRILILDKVDTLKEPIHIMEGVLLNNKFTYTSDEDLYVGGGELSHNFFEGYYKGPVNGTYRMWRLNSEIKTK
jgi:hypothetical protein